MDQNLILILLFLQGCQNIVLYYYHYLDHHLLQLHLLGINLQLVIFFSYLSLSYAPLNHNGSPLLTCLHNNIPSEIRISLKNCFISMILRDSCQPFISIINTIQNNCINYITNVVMTTQCSIVFINTSLLRYFRVSVFLFLV